MASDQAERRTNTLAARTGLILLLYRIKLLFLSQRRRGFGPLLGRVLAIPGLWSYEISGRPVYVENVRLRIERLIPEPNQGVGIGEVSLKGYRVFRKSVTIVQRVAEVMLHETYEVWVDGGGPSRRV